MIEWAISGVNTNSSSGGPECRAYMSDTRRFVESIFVIGFAIYITFWGYSRITLPKSNKYSFKYDPMSISLLALFAVALGIELGFKFATSTVIYLFNPCHLMTVMQLYLLGAQPSNQVTAVFRIHLNLLNGPILAFLFPETDNRLLPFEKWIYWIQHSMLIIVPYYLLRKGQVYNVEPLRDWSWCVLSYGLNLLYHFVILQPFALPIAVNLNHMLCPSDTDPFAGPYYRIYAVIHQGLLCPIACKIACYFLASSINQDNDDLALVRFKKSRIESKKGMIDNGCIESKKNS